MKMTLTGLVAASIALTAGAALARDQIRIVGSSTVFPYTQAVAEEFANTTGNPAPVVESTGTGGGMKIFCGGIGEGHPDITGASRAMKKSEFDDCVKNGVTEVTEVLIGFDGLSIAQAITAGDLDLTKAQIYMALGAMVPVNGEWAANPYKNWNEIDPSLPSRPILVYGPPPTSGTRDAFVELAMWVGCEELDYVKSGGFDGDWVEENCSRMRQDGPFVEAGENDNLIVQRLVADPTAVGIFGYSFLYENQDTLKAAAVDGVLPSIDAIGDGSYQISRPLYFYTKNAHRGVIPGFAEFVELYVSEESMGPGGFLSERGLVPLNDTRRAAVQQAALTGATFAPE
ncbi:MAG: substrate-binding domain-containing protein [Rubrimonas sp.]|uniref:substrate-binding domain-containing protein n=1 Tax=Rubrimonas sp. TaxID=2036015 RepID=UPI002FDD70D8